MVELANVLIGEGAHFFVFVVPWYKHTFSRKNVASIAYSQGILNISVMTCTGV